MDIDQPVPEEPVPLVFRQAVIFRRKARCLGSVIERVENYTNTERNWIKGPQYCRVDLFDEAMSSMY